MKEKAHCKHVLIVLNGRHREVDFRWYRGGSSHNPGSGGITAFKLRVNFIQSPLVGKEA